MRCDEALERMLEAAPAELRGEVDTGLARHIAACDRCGAVAAAMIDETDAVDGALDSYAVGRPIGGPTAGRGARVGSDADRARAATNAAADAALAAVRAEEGSDAVPLRSRWVRTAWIPLAAAAALAAVLVVGRGDPFSGPPSTGVPASAEPHIEPRVSVTPPADRGAAIMETGNPDITIVWLYEREES